MLAQELWQDILSTPAFAVIVAALLTGATSPTMIESPKQIWLWCGSLAIWSLVAWAMRQAYLRDKGRTPHWGWRFAVLYAVNSSCWAAILFFGGPEPIIEALLLMVMLGLLTAYLVTISSHLLSLVVANLVVFLAIMIFASSYDDPLMILIRFIYPPAAIYLLIQGIRNHNRIIASLAREEATRELIGELTLANRRVEQESRAKSEFFATMSHELRTPLNAIIGFAEIMRSELFGPLGGDAYRGYATDIQGSGQDMLQMIDGLLSIADLEKTDAVAEQRPVAVAALFALAGRRVNDTAWPAKVALRFECADGREILADALLVAAALGHIIANALEHTPEGGTVTVAAEPYAVGELTLKVSDTGTGIATERLAIIDDPFHLGADWVAGSGRRIGLGLLISRRIMQAHGGKLEIESYPGTGTTVRLRFPASRVQSGGGVAEERQDRRLSQQAM